MWATCWARACNWLLLRALAPSLEPSLRLHRCNLFCGHCHCCRSHADNNTPSQKCDLRDEHLNPRMGGSRINLKFHMTMTISLVLSPLCSRKLRIECIRLMNRHLSSGRSAPMFCHLSYLHSSLCTGSDSSRHRHTGNVFRIATIFTDEGEQTGRDMPQE